jgi:hypothetical protein
MRIMGENGESKVTVGLNNSKDRISLFGVKKTGWRR